MKLISQKPFPVPEAMVEKQTEAVLERRLRTLAGQGIDPRRQKLDWEALRARWDPARREVRILLALDEVARRRTSTPPPPKSNASWRRPRASSSRASRPCAPA